MNPDMVLSQNHIRHMKDSEKGTREMLRLNCPFCGLRDHHEFAYLEDASVQMPSFEDTSGKSLV